MRLLKFKDINNPKDHNYNVYLKGKTAYLFNLRYIVPLEFVDQRDLYLFDNDKMIETILREKKCFWDTFYDIEITSFIDYKLTAEINNLKEEKDFFRIFPGRQIPMKALKNFRTWLATSLDIFAAPKEESWKHVLHYYMHGMHDDTIRWLSIFGNGYELKQKPSPGCGCSNKQNTTSTSTCNTITLYKTGIYNAMVDRFSNIQYWASLPKSFIKEFKMYIDGILLSGLPINVFNTHVSLYANCNCQTEKDENRIFIRGVLERLSASLNYIIMNDITGHINFISKALREWSEYLYEKMEWD